MKPISVIAAAAVLCSGALAYAQSAEIAVAPPSRSTGPTVPDTRQVDQQTMTTPSSSAAAPTSANDPSYGNWRASDGLNADPNNPSGAPGPSSGLGTSPSR
jgi:hypothetical protein